MGVRAPLLGKFGDDFAWSLLDAAPDGVFVVSRAGEIVFVNDHAAAMFRTEPAVLLGQSVESLLPDDVRQAHRAHRTRFQAEPKPRSMGVGLILRGRRSDASVFPIEVSLNPLRLGDELFVVAAVRDVTERVETEEHLRRVLQTLDASDDGVFIFDAQTLRYSYVNEGAVRLVGYDREALLTMTPMHLNPYDNDVVYRGLVESLQSDGGNAVVSEARLLRKDGVEVPVETTFQCTNAGHNGERWVIAFVRDISTRLAAQTQLRDSQDALRQAEQVVAIAGDRERIARDLHDTVIQRLFGAGMSLQATLALPIEAARARVENTIDVIDDTIKELRMAIFSLQGGAASVGGLRGHLLEVLTEAGPALGFEPRLQFDGPIEGIEPVIAEHLTATLREALSNVTHHAQATSARVIVGVGDEITLTVIDDGVGVPTQVLGGRGLTNMNRRARELGGTFDISREPTGGSHLTWQVPHSPPEPLDADIDIDSASESAGGGHG